MFPGLGRQGGSREAQSPFLGRLDKAFCSGPLSFRAEAGDNTVSHPAAQGLLSQCVGLYCSSLLCAVLSDMFYHPSPKVMCQRQPLDFFCIYIECDQGVGICEGLILHF